jgi:hypothetical protein
MSPAPPQQVPQATPEPATPSPQERVLSFDGQVVRRYNPEAVAAQRQGELRERLSPAMTQDTSEEGQRAWAQAIEFATARVPYVGVDDAAKIAEDRQRWIVNQYYKERLTRAIASGRGRGTGVPGSGGAKSYREEVAGGNQLLSFVRTWSSTHNIKGYQDSLAAAKRFAALAESENPTAQTAALGFLTHLITDNRPSNSEHQFVQNSFGKFNEFQKEWNAYMEGGKLPDNYRARMKELGEALASIYLSEVQMQAVKAGDAANRIRGLQGTTIDETPGDVAARMIMGGRLDDTVAGPTTRPAPEDGADVDAEVEAALEAGGY